MIDPGNLGAGTWRHFKVRWMICNLHNFELLETCFLRERPWRFLLYRLLFIEINELIMCVVYCVVTSSLSTDNHWSIETRLLYIYLRNYLPRFFLSIYCTLLPLHVHTKTFFLIKIYWTYVFQISIINYVKRSIDFLLITFL